MAAITESGKAGRSCEPDVGVDLEPGPPHRAGGEDHDLAHRRRQRGRRALGAEGVEEGG
jgi:hypothetical protein